jgi:hypothetical protein
VVSAAVQQEHRGIDEVERVISSHKGYEVVVKEGAAAEVARDLSPGS